MQVDLPNTLKIPMGRDAAYGYMDVDISRLAVNVISHLFEYGVRQNLNDAIATKKDDKGNALSTDELIAKAQKRLDAFYAGEVRTRGEGAEPVDPVEREAFRLAKAFVVDNLRATEQWRVPDKSIKGDDRLQDVFNLRRKLQGLEPVDWRDFVKQHVMSNFMAQAQDIVALRTASPKQAERIFKRLGL